MIRHLLAACDGVGSAELTKKVLEIKETMDAAEAEARAMASDASKDAKKAAVDTRRGRRADGDRQRRRRWRARRRRRGRRSGRRSRGGHGRGRRTRRRRRTTPPRTWTPR